jgi:hypothetical protein
VNSTKTPPVSASIKPLSPASRIDALHIPTHKVSVSKKLTRSIASDQEQTNFLKTLKTMDLGLVTLFVKLLMRGKDDITKKHDTPKIVDAW